jgi:hypothetical protein
MKLIILLNFVFKIIIEIGIIVKIKTTKIKRKRTIINYMIIFKGKVCDKLKGLFHLETGHFYANKRCLHLFFICFFYRIAHIVRYVLSKYFHFPII